MEEGFGWESEGTREKPISAEAASIRRNELMQNARLGEGPTRLVEKRSIAKAKKAAEEQERRRQERDSTTFLQYFEQVYYPTAKTHKKSQTYKKEELHVRLWIGPVIGNKPLKDIRPLDLERLKKKLLDRNKSPRTIQYIFATFRQVWNMARRDGIVHGDSPTRTVKLIRFDNKRQRYLTATEESALLDDLRKRNPQIHDMTLLALRTGMRASEIFKLKWGHLDFDRGQILILDGKGVKHRTAFMTEDVRAMLTRLDEGEHDDLVFPTPQGKQYKEISDSFKNAVRNLGLNKDVSDKRQKVCFHTCRHTFASRLVESGIDLYTVKTLLGHSSITLTERYSHLSEGTLQHAIKTLEKTMKQTQPDEKASDQPNALSA